VANTRHHGGPDQAVYVYSAEDYAWWASSLGPLDYGTFGENLTFSGFGDVCIGDRFKVGAVVLEVSAPRIPCDVLAAKMQDHGFVKKFRQAARPGFYARIVEPGLVYTGDPISKISSGTLPLVEVFALWYTPKPSTTELKRVLESPIAQRARAHYSEHLDKAEDPSG
jgi:MOSC domain-containing protein YiiM